MKQIQPHASYPTPTHEQAATAAVSFFSSKAEVDAVLLTCSCARGKATKDSCVDIAVLLQKERPIGKENQLEAQWQNHYRHEPIFDELRSVGAYSHIDLLYFRGEFQPTKRDWLSGADEFELEIGNLLAYAVPLFERNDHFHQLQEHWLPYYSEDLRKERLAMVLKYCHNNLDHIPIYVKRQLYFQAFDRLYKAFGEFLQALFISKRVYPIAYDKWIHEQIVEILELPQLYARLPKLLEIEHFESEDLAQKAHDLKQIIAEYIS